jgi:hypothetical protein
VSGQLIQLSDDGEPEINIVVHGYHPARKRPLLDILKSQVNHAELRGQVYLYHWESGGRPIPGGRYVVTAGALVPIPHVQFPLLVIRLGLVLTYNLARFLKNMRRADQMGRRLARNLHKLKDSHRFPITLIGHSLGGRVVTSALCHVDSARFNVRRAVLLAAAMEEPPNGYDWKDVTRPLNRELVNVWSDKDKILWYLKPRMPLTLCIGSDPISDAPSKVRNKRCSFGHTEYMEQLGYILDRAIKGRKRSKNYTGRVYVQCPNERCRLMVGVLPNTMELCPDCGIEFEYNPAADRCYWEHSPKWVLCIHCEEEEILVQETAEYQCSYCRGWNNFERVGNTVYES